MWAVALTVQHEPEYLFGMFNRYCAISSFDRNPFKCFPIRINTFLMLKKEKLGRKKIIHNPTLKKQYVLTC